MRAIGASGSSWLAAGAAMAALFIPVPLRAQYPGQYPPTTYPPSTYPPGQYPPNYPGGGGYPPGGGYPGSYPPGSIPTPIPGVSLPTPKIPGRKEKTDSGALKVTVASVTGRLRKLAEKELLLQTNPKTVLRFRLLRKTEFRDKKGETVRDSLLQPGDELSIDVSPEDEETALFVVLVRSGSSADRAAAEKPVEESAVRAPKTSDLGKPHTVTSGRGEAAPADATSDSAASAGAADASPGANGDPAAPPEPPKPHDPKLDTDERLLADARATAAEYSSKLPNYIAQQVTSRFYAGGFPAQWLPIDVITADVAYVDGKEDYRNIRVNDAQVESAALAERRVVDGRIRDHPAGHSLPRDTSRLQAARRGTRRWVAGRGVRLHGEGGELALDDGVSGWARV